MSIEGILYAICLVGVTLLGLVVVLRNRKPVFVYFGLFSFLLTLFLLCQLFVDQATSYSLLAVQLSFIVSELLAPLFLAFVRAFPNRRALPLKRVAFYALPALIMAPFSFSNLLIANTSLQGMTTMIQPGPLYYLQTIVVLAYLVVGLSNLLARLRQADIQERRQIYLLLVAFVVPVITIGLTGTVFVNGPFAELLRPMSVLIMMVIIAYNMVYHSLFDIRLIVARSVAYLLSLGAIAVVYGSVVFVISRFVFNTKLSIQAEVFIILATAIAALSFSYIKPIFDKITNNLFFRDSYDSQTFLDEFNKVLVSTYALNLLLTKCAKIIALNLKPAYAVFDIHERSNVPRKIIGSPGHPRFTDEDIALVRSEASHMNRKIIVVDALETRHARLQQVLRANNVAIVARLSVSGGGETGIGYLLLGPKKSGNPYSSQDIRLIEILANELVIAIQNSLRFEEIESFNFTLQQRVDNATRKLRRTNEKLKALDEAKDDFVSMASHQLRTPLTSIKGYTSMVLEGDAGKINATQRQLLEQSFFSSQRMVYLIADLLNVSRLKTGKFIIEPGPVNLAELVEQEIVQLKETAAGRSLTLTYAMPKKFPLLLLDETKTRQVIMNFVDNAIYYTPAGGHIEVELVETPASVELRVTDNGIGVPRSEQPHLFTKFYRAGNARKARPDGTGLGLFMAKKVVVAEGGAIIFDTEEGKGSTFGFVFSKTKLAPTSKPAVEPATISVK